MISICRYAPGRMEKAIIPNQWGIEKKMMSSPQDRFKKRYRQNTDEHKTDPFDYAFDEMPI